MSTENKIKSTYLLTEYNYRTGKQQVVSVCTDKYNALAELQDRAINYIQEKDGLEKTNGERAVLEQYVYNYKKLTALGVQDLDGALKKQPTGHYIMSDIDEHLYKWTIWQKYEVELVIRGYLGKYPTKIAKTRKVFDIDIVMMPFDIFSALYRKYRYLCVEHRLLKSQTCDKSVASDEMIYQRNYAQSVCSDFSKLLAEIPAFNALAGANTSDNESKGVKLSELITQYPGDFGKYKKVFYATPVIRSVRETEPMYMSLMEDITESIERDDTANALGNLIKPLQPAVSANEIEAQISIGNQKKIQKELARQAIGALSELQRKRDERIERQSLINAEPCDLVMEDEDIKPPWLGLKKM
jgi:hypothetical protein